MNTYRDLTFESDDTNGKLFLKIAVKLLSKVPLTRENVTSLKFTDVDNIEREALYREKIGEGGFANVYLGWNAFDPKQLYAIK